MQPQQTSHPQHIAIIMDGNGRWAHARALPRVMGHRAGLEAVKRAMRAVKEAGVPYLTLYAFSSENWKRSSQEVQDLMILLRTFLKSEMAEMHKEGVRLRIIGERNRFSSDITALFEQAEELTRGNTTLNLTVALSYGGRQEVVNAAQALAQKVREGSLDPAAIDESMIGAALYTADMPDPDIILRTSGEKRLSNFLLWQSAYAEFVFLDTLWPDFSGEDLARALDEYNRRERRYGARIG
jgi:undecaprenyl diphosphate synthase